MLLDDLFQDLETLTVESTQLFKIPIDEFEEDMETELSRGKKEEIHQLFTNNNHLTKEEFYAIKYKLHDACREGNLELIKIYLCEEIQNDSKSLRFKIDETNQTASLFNVKIDIKELIVPRTIKYKSVDYLITSVSGTGGNFKTLKFVEDSAVKTIHNNAFFGSNIKEIYFPDSLIELKDRWCYYTSNLTKIVISPSNGQFKFLENKYLVGKSDSNKEDFDNLLFACRDIKEISIPSNIRIISSFAFDDCQNLTKVEILPNSNLQIIGKHAFSRTNINEIFIPSKVSIICDSAFLGCPNLKVDFAPNSNLQTIGPDAFSESDIKEIYIPSNTKIISSGAFRYCKYLTKFEIATNSKLEVVESRAFLFSLIKKIHFPASLKELEDNWCCVTNHLTKITISPSNGQFILKDDKYLIGKSDPNNNEFDILLFANRDIKNISIPSNIKIISPCAFQFCKKLSKVDIPTNSNLHSIKSYAFYETDIKDIFIPSNVLKICFYAFANCRCLKRVEITSNSNLQIIEKEAFSFSNIKSIFIPSKVSKICENSFTNCRNLQIIEISEESKLDSIPLQAFDEFAKKYNYDSIIK